MRDADLVARYGGEEFAVLLAWTDTEGARGMAERCRYEVATHPWATRQVTLSLGVAFLGPDLRTRAALVGAADRALYAAKRAGRNRVAVAS